MANSSDKACFLQEYDDEIERLRREVVAMREKNGVYVDPERYEYVLNDLSFARSASNVE